MNASETERPADTPSRCPRELRCACLELGVSLEHQIADTSLRGDIVNRPQEREAVVKFLSAR